MASADNVALRAQLAEVAKQFEAQVQASFEQRRQHEAERQEDWARLASLEARLRDKTEGERLAMAECQRLTTSVNVWKDQYNDFKDEVADHVSFLQHRRPLSTLNMPLHRRASGASTDSSLKTLPRDHDHVLPTSMMSDWIDAGDVDVDERHFSTSRDCLRILRVDNFGPIFCGSDAAC